MDLNVWLQELTKEAIMELTRNEQLKERHEMEKKLQKFAKTMDYLERAKRQEEAPLIEQAFQKRLQEEKILHEQEQLVSFLFFYAYAVQITVSTSVIYFCLQREIELSKQHHAGDLQEKNRLSRMLEHKVVCYLCLCY
jgi:translation initiation factor 3 subunit A